jgi:hypothetical protein
VAIQIGARCPILGCGGYIAYPLGAIQDRPETKFQGQQELRLRAWRCSEEHDVLERIVDPAKEPDPPNAHAVRASFAPRRRPGGSGRGAARERGDRPVAGGAPCGSTRRPAREANGRVLRAAARGLDGNADRDAGRRATGEELRLRSRRDFARLCARRLWSRILSRDSRWPRHHDVASCRSGPRRDQRVSELPA